MMSGVTPENIFWRNFDYANTIDYDLVEIYGEKLANVFDIQAKFLLQDACVIALGTTSSIAYFSNQSTILLDNCSYMEKGLASYTLITTCSGFSKSDTFLEISDACNDIDELETQFKTSQDNDASEKSLTKSRLKKISKTNSGESSSYVCEKVLNEFTGPGCIAALAENSNVLGLFDEFDDDSQKTNIFPSKDKFTNAMINCKSFIQTVFSCPAKYVKATADRLTILIRPRLSIIGGSNGSILIEIIRKKLNNSMISDPMVERFDFVSIRSTGSLVANRLQTLPQHSIRIKFLLLFVHMINGKTFMFDKVAQHRQKQFTDELTARSLRFERFDSWLSVRFRKSREYSLRMCAYLATLKLAYELAYEFVSKQPASFNSFDRMTIDVYKNVKDFITEKNLPNTLFIDEETVQSAHKATFIMILKYLNLTSINTSLNSAIQDVPAGPPATSMASFGMQYIPSTQEASNQHQRPVTPPPTIENNKEFKAYCKIMLMIDSVLFTRSSIHKESQLKKNLKYFDPAVAYLETKELLHIYKNGMISADGKPFICYVKALPKSYTQNTVLEFSRVLDLLDVQYPTYIATFNTMWLSDRNQCSDEVLKVLNNKPYDQYTFEIKYLPSKVKASTVASSTLATSPSYHTPLVPSNIPNNTISSESNDANNVLLNLVSTTLMSTSPSLRSSTVINNNVPRLSTTGTKRTSDDTVASAIQSNSSITINGNQTQQLLTTHVQSTPTDAIATSIVSLSRSSSSESLTVDKETNNMTSDTSVREQASRSSSKRKIVQKGISRRSKRRKR